MTSGLTCLEMTLTLRAGGFTLAQRWQRLRHWAVALVKVKNRELGELLIREVRYSPPEACTLISFRSEAGELTATLWDDGTLAIADPAYPRLRFRTESFRPLIMELLGVAHTENQAGSHT